MKKLILIPITLTALTPMVSMVGCGTATSTTIYLNKWNNDKGYLYKDKFHCNSGQDITLIINFKDNWDPNNEKKEILGEFHLINDSKLSYNFWTEKTNITVGAQTLEFEEDWDWAMEDIALIWYIKITNEEVKKQLISAEKVEIKTQVDFDGKPGPLGFYAI